MHVFQKDLIGFLKDFRPRSFSTRSLGQYIDQKAEPYLKPEVKEVIGNEILRVFQFTKMPQEYDISEYIQPVLNYIETYTRLPGLILQKPKAPLQ